jgi:hypothetical protein
MPMTQGHKSVQIHQKIDFSTDFKSVNNWGSLYTDGHKVIIGTTPPGDSVGGNNAWTKPPIYGQSLGVQPLNMPIARWWFPSGGYEEYANMMVAIFDWWLVSESGFTIKQQPQDGCHAKGQKNTETTISWSF